MNNIRLFHTTVQDRRLPNALIQGRDWPSIVIGNDLNRVRYLASALNARDATHQKWRAHSLRELAMLKAPEKVLGRDDYRSVLILKRRALTRNLRRVGASADWVPKADRLLELTLAHGRDANEYKSSLRWLYEEADQALDEFDYRFLDDPEAMGDPWRLPFLNPDIESYQLVCVVSSSMSTGEAAWLEQYLERDYILAPEHEVVVVAEDRAAWRDILNRPGLGVKIWEESLDSFSDAWPRSGEKVRLGAVSWKSADWMTQFGRIRNLLVQTIRDGGSANDIRVVTDSAGYAHFVRTELFAMGLPIQCSESELLPTNPVAVDLLSLITLTRDRKHVQSLCRLAQHLRINPTLEIMLDMFKEGATDDGHDRLKLDERSTAALDAWHAFEHKPKVYPAQYIYEAKDCYEHWAGEKALLRSEAIADGLIQWAEQFDSVDAMIECYWRFRAIIAPWTGYRPESGIHVSSVSSAKREAIVVFLTAFTKHMHPKHFEDLGKDVYHAHVQERPDSPEHKIN